MMIASVLHVKGCCTCFCNMCALLLHKVLKYILIDFIELTRFTRKRNLIIVLDPPVENTEHQNLFCVTFMYISIHAHGASYIDQHEWSLTKPVQRTPNSQRSLWEL